MTNDIHDSDMFDLLETGFAGAGYNRSAATFTPSRVAPRVAAAGVVAVAALAGTVVISGRNDDAMAYGWTSTSREATEAERAKALALCDMTLTVSETDDRITMSEEFNTSGVPFMEVDTLDLRGDIAIATLHAAGTADTSDFEFSRLCVLDTSADVWTTGTSVDLGVSDGSVLNAVAQTDLLTERTIITGLTPLRATAVAIHVPGLPVATVAVHHGEFATWLPATITGGTFTAFDADGATLGSAPIEVDPT